MWALRSFIHSFIYLFIFFCKVPFHTPFINNSTGTAQNGLKIDVSVRPIFHTVHVFIFSGWCCGISHLPASLVLWDFNLRNRSKKIESRKTLMPLSAGILILVGCRLIIYSINSHHAPVMHLSTFTMELGEASQNFNIPIMLLSYAISVLGAQTSLELLGRRTDSKGIYNW